MPEQPKHLQYTHPSLWAKLKPLAREKRHEPTLAEDKLWQQLRNRRLDDLKFRRQYVIDRFIVDFYCAEYFLAVEVDGDIHNYTCEEDAIRQEVIKAYGIHVLRFKNDDVIHEIDKVLHQISRSIEQQRSESP